MSRFPYGSSLLTVLNRKFRELHPDPKERRKARKTCKALKIARMLDETNKIIDDMTFLK